MAKKNAAKPKNPSTKPLSPAQIAARLTWQLKGDLKNAQIAFLRVGAKLARIRDEKLFAALKHADMIAYASKDLRLSPKSLYRYLQVYDWVLKNHPSWLKPKTKDKIPDLNDIVDLIQINKDLANKRLAPEKKKALENLREKAEKGDLKKGELGALRKRTSNNTKDATAGIVRILRTARRRLSALKTSDPEWIVQLDRLIGMIENQKPLTLAGLEALGRWLDDTSAAVLS